jgi:Domain of unknown function (DUF4350)
MRQRLLIIITIVFVLGLLILLNAASYVQLEQVADSEIAPDRSTFNSRATGTRALFDFLRESGFSVDRWRETTATLLDLNSLKPSTIVVIGRTVVPFSKADREGLLKWVASGGRLVIIDRHPDPGLLPDSGEFTVSSYSSSFPADDLDPNSLEQMTAGVKPVPPSQPTLLSRGVETILPSRFAGLLTVAAGLSKKSEKGKGERGVADDNPESETEKKAVKPAAKNAALSSPAPVVNFARPGGALLADFPHGKGRIVLLSDPFIVANNGIGRADNLELAVNIITSGGGLVVFDEFHQGRGATHNALIQYFEGTPIIAIFGQCVLIALVIIWSRGRRFARPLPLPQVDRRSSLEFVASMAELQQRARAHDLALENIYGRVRRVLVRYAGMSNSSPRAEIARRVATRSGLKQQELEMLMLNCESTINGAPTNAKETLRMVKRLRQIEARLGLRTRSRDARQAAERAHL